MNHVRKILSDQFWKNKDKIMEGLRAQDMETYGLYVEINCEIKRRAT